MIFIPTILVNFVIFDTTYSLRSGGLFDAFFVKRGRRQRKMVSGTFMTACNNKDMNFSDNLN